MIEPDWAAPQRVRAFVTTRAMGDMAGEEGRRRLSAHLPAAPHWLRQVHGTAVVDADAPDAQRVGDAAVARRPGTVCAILAADCMPVLLADGAGRVVGVAHAGWRGLAAGVLEETVRAMGVAPGGLVAWLGPAIGPSAYEVGDDVRLAFAGYESAFRPARRGHWLLDLYAVARERLDRCGVRRIAGGGFCTYSDAERFFSYRRERASGRMAALIWLT